MDLVSMKYDTYGVGVDKNTHMWSKSICSNSRFNYFFIVLVQSVYIISQICIIGILCGSLFTH